MKVGIKFSKLQLSVELYAFENPEWGGFFVAVGVGLFLLGFMY